MILYQKALKLQQLSKYRKDYNILYFQKINIFILQINMSDVYFKNDFYFTISIIFYFF